MLPPIAVASDRGKTWLVPFHGFNIMTIVRF